MKVADALQGVVQLGLDTPPVICFVERNPIYYTVCEFVFRQIAQGTLQGVAGAVTLTETLKKPLRLNDQQIADSYRTLLTKSAGMKFVPVGTEVAEIAADLWARYNLKTADALQVAAALSVGCDAFLTGDKDLRRVAELQVLVLDDLTL